MIKLVNHIHNYVALKTSSLRFMSNPHRPTLYRHSKLYSFRYLFSLRLSVASFLWELLYRDKLLLTFLFYFFVMFLSRFKNLPRTLFWKTCHKVYASFQSMNYFLRWKGRGIMRKKNIYSNSSDIWYMYNNLFIDKFFLHIQILVCLSISRGRVCVRVCYGYRRRVMSMCA